MGRRRQLPRGHAHRGGRSHGRRARCGGGGHQPSRDRPSGPSAQRNQPAHRTQASAGTGGGHGGGSIGQRRQRGGRSHSVQCDKQQLPLSLQGQDHCPRQPRQRQDHQPQRKRSAQTRRRKPRNSQSTDCGHWRNSCPHLGQRQFRPEHDGQQHSRPEKSQRQSSNSQGGRHGLHQHQRTSQSVCANRHGQHQTRRGGERTSAVQGIGRRKYRLHQQRH